MADEHKIVRYRKWYRTLLGFYPTSYRKRFGESMEQTFNDVCRERSKSGKNVFTFVLWMFAETFVGIVRVNATSITSSNMKQDPAHALRMVKYAAIAAASLMVAGIVTLMFLSRGTGEDITGIVAPALLITFVSTIVAIVAYVMQKRTLNAVGINRNNDLRA